MRPLPLYPLISVSHGQILDSKDPLDAPNFDPEGLSYDSDFASAADGYTYPILKSVTVGVNITF